MARAQRGRRPDVAVTASKEPELELDQELLDAWASYATANRRAHRDYVTSKGRPSPINPLCRACRKRRTQDRSNLCRTCRATMLPRMPEQLPS